MTDGKPASLREAYDRLLSREFGYSLLIERLADVAAERRRLVAV